MDNSSCSEVFLVPGFKFALLVFKCETSCFVPGGHGELLSLFLTATLRTSENC